MSEPDLPPQAVQLRVLDFVRREHSLAWAVLSPELVVRETSERFQAFQWDPAVKPHGRPISSLIWELVGLETGLEEVVQGREELFCLENINRQDTHGVTIYLTLEAIPLLKDEPGRGLLLLIEDTTLTSTLEQQLVQDRNELRLARSSLARANEELRRLNRLKSLFLSMAAHDLRAPLTAMRGYAELAAGSLPAESAAEVADYLSTILSLIDALNRLVGDFLDLDILEQGKLTLRPAACQLNSVVREVSAVMGAVGRRRDVGIEIKLKEGLPLVYADPLRMQQILFNLAGNAIKYTGPGDHVLIETDSTEDRVLVRVRDHGPGIPESEIPHLFDLYHRSEEARQSLTRGLGLGLFIVKSLVELQQGEVSVRSQPGMGAEFTVGLPILQANTGGRA